MWEGIGIRQWCKRKVHKMKAKAGVIPHGRTVPPVATPPPPPDVELIESGNKQGGVLQAHSLLIARHIRNGKEIGRRVIHDKVVTDVGVAYIVDAFQNSVELENMKYHGSGTGVGAEAAGNTTLGTEIAITRATGTTTEGATANIYRTVGTQTYDGSYAVTEHGIFSASSTGVLLDRSVFSAINVQNLDQIEWTYELTLTAGG